MMDTERHWLDRYATGYHRWRRVEEGDAAFFVRPLGLVEKLFHYDGALFEGRSDVYMVPDCAVRTTLTKEAIREHLLYVWATLRAEHSLLRAQKKSVTSSSPQAWTADGLDGLCYVVPVPRSVHGLLAEARRTLMFAEDYHPDLDRAQFIRHGMNTARFVDHSDPLARLVVLPLEPAAEVTRYRMDAFIIGAHDIMDGLTTFVWTAQFLSLMNLDLATLRARMERLLGPNAPTLWKRLPPAQEDIYPPVGGSRARQRWYWAISRILRHVRTPLPAAFPNPLRRDQVQAGGAEKLPPLFDKIFDYSRSPPLTSRALSQRVSTTEVDILRAWCREAGTSIGAGGFALVALAMMECHEERFPDIPLDQRRAFVASFPLDPRHYVNYTAPPDSMMLAFSDGIAFPFLPSYLPVKGRFMLLVKHAHRQLSVYQKRPRSTAGVERLGSRSGSQVIPALYTSFVEQIERLEPPVGRLPFAPQGDFPANFRAQEATCGVSSIGVYADFFRDVMRPLDGRTTFQASLLSATPNVRSRHDEFLCGIGTGPEGFGYSVSFDCSAHDEARVQRWSSKMQSLLRPDAPSNKL